MEISRGQLATSKHPVEFLKFLCNCISNSCQQQIFLFIFNVEKNHAFTNQTNLVLIFYKQPRHAWMLLNYRFVEVQCCVANSLCSKFRFPYKVARRRFL